ncbi:MAG: hypothetical protein ACI8RZ_002135, partial [Myxococcota bacterium]
AIKGKHGFSLFYGLNESDQGVDEHRASPDAFSSYPDLKTQGEAAT